MRTSSRCSCSRRPTGCAVPPCSAAAWPTPAGSGKIKLVGKIDYTLEGEVAGDDLRIDIHSSKGEFKLQGVRA